MKKCSGKIMLVGMIALLASAFISCGNGTPGGNGNSQPGPGPAPVKDGLINPYEGEDKLGQVSENLLDDGDADECEGEIFFSSWGSEKTKVDGGVTGKAWRIYQNEEEWSELGIDITKLYGQGKSYLITAKVKNDPENTAHKNASFKLAWTLYSGAVKNYCDENNIKYYDFPDETVTTIESPWGGKFDETGEAFGYSEDDLNVVDVLSDEWQEIVCILPSTHIEEKVGNSGVYEFQLSFYAGAKGEEGYSFLIDDICIKDLNSELKRYGQTWEDPNAEEEEADDSDSEEDDE